MEKKSGIIEVIVIILFVVGGIVWFQTSSKQETIENLFYQPKEITTLKKLKESAYQYATIEEGYKVYEKEGIMDDKKQTIYFARYTEGRNQDIMRNTVVKVLLDTIQNEDNLEMKINEAIEGFLQRINGTSAKVGNSLIGETTTEEINQNLKSQKTKWICTIEYENKMYELVFYVKDNKFYEEVSYCGEIKEKAKTPEELTEDEKQKSTQDMPVQPNSDGGVG